MSRYAVPPYVVTRSIVWIRDCDFMHFSSPDLDASVVSYLSFIFGKTCTPKRGHVISVLFRVEERGTPATQGRARGGSGSNVSVPRRLW